MPWAFSKLVQPPHHPSALPPFGWLSFLSTNWNVETDSFFFGSEFFSQGQFLPITHQEEDNLSKWSPLIRKRMKLIMTTGNENYFSKTLISFKLKCAQKLICILYIFKWLFGYSLFLILNHLWADFSIYAGGCSISQNNNWEWPINTLNLWTYLLLAKPQFLQYNSWGKT